MSRPLTRAFLGLGLAALLAVVVLIQQEPTAGRNEPTNVAVQLVGKVHADNRGDPMGLAVVGNWAYLTASDDGLYIVDVSNPAAPKPVATCRLPGSARGVAVAGPYAYVAAREGGLRVVDVSNPNVPEEVGSYQPIRAVREGAVEAGPLVEAVAVTGKYLCVTSNYVSEGEANRRSVLHVLDTANPNAPVEVGFLELGDQFLGVFAVENYAYIADKGSTLYVVDISDPQAPALAGACSALGEPHGVFVSGSRAYVADDDGAMHIVDISDPKSPIRVGSFEDGVDRPGIAEAVAATDRYAYVCADGGHALHVVDVFDPNAPKEVASFDTEWPARGVAVAGEYVYVNVWRGGLFILKITEQPGEG